ncbi:hypothetical protein OnM2_056033 [Erysiphe neolycopersici]|uniref:Cep57 centrosome microtubule-binding domain-containing protein n=1 Tax=Erysiphe neolycopersici TaxID=212602 RepID=A0A420HQZ3_9PEZI|nr:hypothetical protein OnM2_056033 [Erysiphe neolycopersici]
MPHDFAEARLMRSQLINQRATNLLRSTSPISSTGSCHGTVDSDTNSEVFSGIDEDIANGDIWNSTGNFYIPPRDRKLKNEVDNIRSTAKKHGRWEPRSQQVPIFNTSAIANAFPDFTSIGEATIEENRMANSAESISVEIARGQTYKSNMASPRQSQSNQESNNISNPQQTSKNPTVDPSLRSFVPKVPKLNQKTSNKTKAVGRQVSSEQEKTTRTTLHRNTNISSSNAINVTKREIRSSHGLKPYNEYEIENSILYKDQANSFTNISNSTTANTHHSKQSNKNSLTQRSSRFVDYRSRVGTDEKPSCVKDKVSEILNAGLNSGVDNYHLNTPCKRTTRATHKQNRTEQNTVQGNPTQTTTSFLIPWNNNIHITTSPNTGVPVFTAQGKVQNIRLPHEYLDSIDLPVEEEQIYDMIDNMKIQTHRNQEIYESIKQKDYQSAREENLAASTRRSDSGLGESGSEVLGPTAGTTYKEDIHKTNRESYQCDQVQNKTNNMTDPETQRLSLLNKSLENQLSTLLSGKKELLAENWARANENRDLVAKIHKLQAEIRQLEREITSNKQKMKEKDDVIKTTSEDLKNLRSERKLDASNWCAKSRDYEHQIKEFRIEIIELHRKLDRSEKSCKILKDNSEKILESTRILESTKIKRSSEKASAQNDNQSKKNLTSQSLTEHVSLENELSTDKPSVPMKSFDDTIDFETSNVSYSDDGSSIHSTVKHTIEGNNLIESNSSNFSDILGHGFAEKMRSKVGSLNELIEQQNKDDQTDFRETENVTKFENTTQSIESEPSLNSVASTPAVTVPQENLPEKISLQRSKSLTEKNITITSKTSACHNSASNILKSSPLQDPTSSSDVIKSTFTSKVNVREKSYSKNETNNISDNHHNHTCKNCSICVRKTSTCTKKTIKSTIRIDRPIPVSERMPVVEPYEDQPTMRPSTSPGIALAKAISMIKDELNHLSQKYHEVANLYFTHDHSLSRSSRLSWGESMRTLLIDIGIKNDLLYKLYDVLEGQKIAQQEMTSDFLDVTLTELGIKFDETWNGCEN